MSQRLRCLAHTVAFLLCVCVYITWTKLTLLQAIQIGFDANYGLFTSSPQGLAYPQPAAAKIPNGLGLLEFLGLVVGKALYEGILLDVPLASFFVARLQGRRPMFDELVTLDADLHKSLLQLKRCNAM